MKKSVLLGSRLYHGKRGYGVSVEAGVKNGPITLLSLTQTREGTLKFLGAEGVCRPGERVRIGNTNSRLHFDLGPADFMNAWCRQGPTHHCALGVGHVLDRVEKVPTLLDLELHRVSGASAGGSTAPMKERHG